PDPALRLQLALSLVRRDKFDETARVLRTISEADQRAHRVDTDQIIQTLINRKQYRAALSISKQIEPDPSQLAVIGQVWNGGFELDFPLIDRKPFHWSIDSRPQSQLGVDMTGHNSSRSLRMTFRAPSQLDGIVASQTIIVEPNTS